MNILLIGAGGLGRRYLQGMQALPKDTFVSVVEPSSENIALAKDLIYPNELSVVFYKSLGQITAQSFDVAIIATNSDVRSAVIQDLLSRVKVKSMLIEKVLFQTLEDYSNISRLLESKGVKAWVNHPRRYYALYQNLAKIVSSKEHVFMEVSGAGWGLCSNAIHYLDLYEFLTESKIKKIDTTELDECLLKSKREGFIEMTGSLKAYSEKGKVNLFDGLFSSPVSITLTCDDLKIIIDETGNKVYSSQDIGFGDGGRIVYYQSEITAKTILDTQVNGCLLPGYKEAFGLHTKYIDALLQFVNSIESQTADRLQIT